MTSHSKGVSYMKAYERDEKAVSEGWEAYCQSKDRNPYPKDDPRHSDWEHGWARASEEA
jgi:hypothetical protein